MSRPKLQLRHAHGMNRSIVFSLMCDVCSCTGKEADNFFNVLIVVAFIVFTVEIIAASLGDRSYLFSFFFYLDAWQHDRRTSRTVPLNTAPGSTAW